jgi:hypothetical protein
LERRLWESQNPPGSGGEEKKTFLASAGTRTPVVQPVAIATILTEVPWLLKAYNIRE